MPPIAGLAEVSFLTNRTIFGLERLPRRLVVLGGGAVGLELAEAFRRFGSEVTVVELLERLLPREEPEAGETIAQVLREEGVGLRLGAEVESVERRNGQVVLHVAGGEVVCDALLVAAGRTGSVEGLGLELELDGGYVEVDDRCRTSLPHVYAAGDVTGGLQFTHVASQEGVVAGRNAAGTRARKSERVVPSVTFTDPEIARVGLTELEARERHGGVEVHVFPSARRSSGRGPAS